MIYECAIIGWRTDRVECSPHPWKGKEKRGYH